MEAKEEEEISPKYRLGMKEVSKKGEQIPRGSKIFSDDGDFEKVSAETPRVKTLPQLVQLDVNIDTLKNFLEDIQEAVNDHAKSIGLIQGDLKKKANEKTVSY